MADDALDSRGSVFGNRTDVFPRYFHVRAGYGIAECHIQLASGLLPRGEAIQASMYAPMPPKYTKRVTLPCANDFIPAS